MYDDYYYEPVSSVTDDVSGGIAGLIFGLMVGVVALGVKLLLFLCTRMDMLSSALLSLTLFLLTFTYDWDNKIYIAMAVGTFLISMILQHALLVFRIIYAVYTAACSSLFGYMFTEARPMSQRYGIMFICFGVTLVVGLLSWKFNIKNLTED